MCASVAVCVCAYASAQMNVCCTVRVCASILIFNARPAIVCRGNNGACNKVNCKTATN